MNLLFHIPREELLRTYRIIKGLLHGNDIIIFNAMTGVNPTFVAPINPGDFVGKHNEIERILNFPNALQGRQLGINLLESVARNVQAQGGVVGLTTQDLINAVKFATSEDVVIQLNNDIHWAANWMVEVNSGTTQETNEISLEIYDRNWGEIVPAYILEFVHSGISLYKKGMYAVTVALLSIAVEATLKDVLEPLGYSFSRGASSVDIFDYTNADIQVDGTDYKISFANPMPSLPNDFNTVSAPHGSATVRVKRVIEPRNRTLSLKIDAPTWFYDFWSTNTPIQLAQRRVNGLGEALDIARNVEGFLTPTVLPTDFDEVLSKVRNNLVHLSRNALATPLTAFDPTGAFTLGSFLENQLMVFDFVTNVPRFINEQYLSLRQSGHLVP